MTVSIFQQASRGFVLRVSPIRVSFALHSAARGHQTSPLAIFARATDVIVIAYLCAALDWIYHARLHLGLTRGRVHCLRVDVWLKSCFEGGHCHGVSAGQRTRILLAAAVTVTAFTHLLVCDRPHRAAWRVAAKRRLWLVLGPCQSTFGESCKD